MLTDMENISEIVSELLPENPAEINSTKLFSGALPGKGAPAGKGLLQEFLVRALRRLPNKNDFKELCFSSSITVSIQVYVVYGPPFFVVPLFP